MRKKKKDKKLNIEKASPTKKLPREDNSVGGKALQKAKEVIEKSKSLLKRLKKGKPGES